jgi:hypothetical protein
MRSKNWESVVATPIICLALCGCSGVGNRLGHWQADKLLQASQHQRHPENAFTLHQLANELTKASTDMRGFTEPPPAVIQTPASASVRHVIGGRGEGLNCSIPRIASTVLFDPIQFARTDASKAPSSEVSLQFSQACNSHDMCYRHGNATYGYAQSDCDAMLFDNAVRLCAAIYKVGNETQHLEQVSDPISTCRAQAGLVHLGVKLFGKTAFRGPAESTYLEFDALARGENRDFSVARIVSTSSGQEQLQHFRFTTGRTVWHAGDQTAPLVGFAAAHQKRMPPPQIPLWIGSGQAHSTAYLTAQRSVFSNTGTRLIAQKTDSAKLTELHRVGPHDDEALDCDTNMHQPLLDASGHVLLTFGVDASATGSRRCQRQVTGSESQVRIQPIRLDTIAQASYYRMHQLSPLIGAFGVNGEPEILAFSRGYYMHEAKASPEGLDLAKKKTHAGENYKEHAAAFRVSFDGKSISTTSINLPDSFLPIAPFKAAGETRDQLLSLTSSATDNTLVAHRWTLTGSVWSSAISQPLPGVDASWIVMPAQVLVRPNHGNLLVLTRIELPDSWYPNYPTEKRWSAVTHGDGKLESTGLSVRLFELTPTGWVAGAHVDSVWQSLPDMAEKIQASSLQADFEQKRSRLGEVCPEKAKTCDPMLRSLAVIWHQAQAIPYLDGFTSAPHAVPAVMFVPHPLTPCATKLAIK